jgi:hypothetical protein
MRRRLIDVEPVVSNVADHLDKLGGVREGMTWLSTFNLPDGYECLCQQHWREKRGEHLMAEIATGRVPALQNSSAES